MKLRFCQNSLRLRLNRSEVARLASGAALEERVSFPGNAFFSYVLEPALGPSAEASLRGGAIWISAPLSAIKPWAADDAVGIYFDVPAEAASLNIAIEKDLECLDLPPEERDPEAFPRAAKSCS